MQKGVSRLGEARAALQLLRNELNVEFELDEIYKDTLGQSLPVCDDKDVDLILPSYTCGQFCGARELFWPISGVVVLVVAQQFSGVYTVFILILNFKFKEFFRMQHDFIKCQATP